MKSVKDIFTYYALLSDGYTGAIKCAKTDENDIAEYYNVETDGNEFEVVRYKDEQRDVIFYHEPGVSTWHSNTANPDSSIVVLDGMPHFAPGIEPITLATFAEMLQEQKVVKHFTVPKFAEFLGVPKRTMDNWLFGTNEPPIFTIKSVYQILGLIK